MRSSKSAWIWRQKKSNASRYCDLDRQHGYFRRSGLDLKEATLDMLGRANTVKVDKDNTTIVDGAGIKMRSRQN